MWRSFATVSSKKRNSTSRSRISAYRKYVSRLTEIFSLDDESSSPLVRTTSRCGIKNRFVSMNSSVMHRSRTQRKWFAMKKVREKSHWNWQWSRSFLLRFLRMFTIECCSLRSTAVHSRKRSSQCRVLPSRSTLTRLEWEHSFVHCREHLGNLYRLLETKAKWTVWVPMDHF